MTTHDDQIRALLATYEQSLNTGNAALAASCYTPDGIFMPTALPTAKGADMHGAYLQIFDAIHLAVTFTIDELEITGMSTLTPVVGAHVAAHADHFQRLDLGTRC